jgi:hypothetical protein
MRAFRAFVLDAEISRLHGPDLPLPVGHFVPLTDCVNPGAALFVEVCGVDDPRCDICVCAVAGIGGNGGSG